MHNFHEGATSFANTGLHLNNSFDTATTKMMAPVKLNLCQQQVISPRGTSLGWIRQSMFILRPQSHLASQIKCGHFLTSKCKVA